MSDEPAAQMWALWAIYFSFRFIRKSYNYAQIAKLTAWNYLNFVSFFKASIERAEFVKNTIKSTITDSKSTGKVSKLCSHILGLIQTTNFIKY